MNLGKPLHNGYASLSYHYYNMVLRLKLIILCSLKVFLFHWLFE